MKLINSFKLINLEFNYHMIKFQHISLEIKRCKFMNALEHENLEEEIYYSPDYIYKLSGDVLNLEQKIRTRKLKMWSLAHTIIEDEAR